MFKNFDPTSDVSTSTQVKASVQRGIKAQIVESHPNITMELLDALLPKKSPLVQYKVGPHLMLYCKHGGDAGDAGPLLRFVVGSGFGAPVHRVQGDHAVRHGGAEKALSAEGCPRVSVGILPERAPGGIGCGRAGDALRVE